MADVAAAVVVIVEVVLDVVVRCTGNRKLISMIVYR